MYKVIWDTETNGVLLKDNVDSFNNILLPRPVFFEELDLLGFNNHWEYPKTETPLLWANGRSYYYKGEKVAEAKGGNIFEPPQIIIEEKAKGLSLEPVNVKLMLEKNLEALRVLENEAMDFVEHTYKSYRKGRNKVDCFAVSFSGGKDSQVVLDIVSRVIPPDEYIVVFTDTDMELPSTYEIVRETEAYYKKLYPELKFYIAKGRLSSEESWRKFGPPSRIHRWCCTVHKTAPYISLINNIIKGKPQPKILTFEGVRADESARRNGYLGENHNRIIKNPKHSNQINAEVIRYWNSTEVFLYLFYRNLKLNKAYRDGLSRIGCSICPFGSEWSEFLINQRYGDVASKYLKILKNYINMIGITEPGKINDFIFTGAWKKKPGWEGVNSNETKITLFQKGQYLEAVISNPNENFMEWIKTIGSLFYKTTINGYYGEIKVGNKYFEFKIKKNNEKNFIINIGKVDADIIFKNKIEKALYKSAYCIHCGACESRCPNRALKITSSIQIDTRLCTHCGNCLYHTEKGCFAAQSVKMIQGGKKQMSEKTMGFSRYKTFGLRKVWLQSFMGDPDNWFSINNLGPIQVYAMIQWLKDAELIEKVDKSPTKICRILQKIFPIKEILAWEIIWINLFYNSFLIRWYIETVNMGDLYSVEELLELGLSCGISNSKNTISSGIETLFNTFETSPLGTELKLGIIERRGNTRYIKKVGTDKIHPIAIAYSLYRYAEAKNSRYLTVSEFYRENRNGGPYRLFGISRERLENILRYLQEDKNGIIRVELTKGLDNLKLRDDLNYIDVLELLSKELKEP